MTSYKIFLGNIGIDKWINKQAYKYPINVIDAKYGTVKESRTDPSKPLTPIAQDKIFNDFEESGAVTKNDFIEPTKIFDPIKSYSCNSDNVFYANYLRTLYTKILSYNADVYILSEFCVELLKMFLESQTNSYYLLLYKLPASYVTTLESKIDTSKKGLMIYSKNKNIEIRPIYDNTTNRTVEDFKNKTSDFLKKIDDSSYKLISTDTNYRAYFGEDITNSDNRFQFGYMTINKIPVFVINIHIKDIYGRGGVSVDILKKIMSILENKKISYTNVLIFGDFNNTDICKYVSTELTKIGFGHIDIDRLYNTFTNTCKKTRSREKASLVAVLYKLVDFDIEIDTSAFNSCFMDLNVSSHKFIPLIMKSKILQSQPSQKRPVQQHPRQSYPQQQYPRAKQINVSQKGSDITEQDYYEKYIKYKTKYIDMKNKLNMSPIQKKIEK